MWLSTMVLVGGQVRLGRRRRYPAIALTEFCCQDQVPAPFIIVPRLWVLWATLQLSETADQGLYYFTFFIYLNIMGQKLGFFGLFSCPI